MYAAKTLVCAFALAAVLLRAMSAHAEAGEQPAVIPFTLFKGTIAVQGTIPPGPTLPFIFDSGLSRTNILSAAAARALGLIPPGQTPLGGRRGGRGPIAFARIDWVEISGVVLRGLQFAIVALRPLLTRRGDKPPIAGYIGAPLLKDAVVCVDYADKELRRWDDGGFDPDGMASIPMQVNHGLVTITVHVDGVPATLAVDTGSDGGVQLFPEFVNKHNLRQRYSDMEPYVAMAGSGQTFSVLRGTAETVRIGETTLENVPMAFISQVFNPRWGIDGLLGYLVLSRLNPCIDRPGRRFLWPADQ